MYRFAKDADISYPVVYNIVNGKKDIKNCSYYVVEKLSHALHMDIAVFVDLCNPRDHFQTFRSEQKHLIKRKGELQYLIEVLENDEIQKAWDEHKKLEAIYLLAMTDYITNKNNIDNCTKYQTIRQYKPDRLIYPADVELEAKLDKNDNSKERALKNAIPEFLSFNIVEGGEI
ncbi:MAG: hypothetical protein IJ695_00830 [Butyrivibrio sp.]|nr:hypothetical protein [Butyrivibrio sp.]